MSINHLPSTILCVILPALALTCAFSLPVSFVSDPQTDSETPRAEKPEVPAENAALNLHRWGAVTLFHGLPSDGVNAIAQDQDGEMWFGTDNGLVRYDGRRTQLFGGAGTTALPTGRIRALHCDVAGGLWIGTDAGAARLASGKLTLIEGTAGRSVRGFAEAPREGVTLVTGQGEILRFTPDGDGGESVSAMVPESDRVRRDTPYTHPDFGRRAALKLDAAGSPLLARQADKAERENTAASPEPRPVELNAVTFSAGAWWIGSRGRGALVNTGAQLRQGKDTPSRPYNIESIFALGDRVWLGESVGRQGNGLWYLEAGALKQYELNTGIVTALHGAGADIWVGTIAKGAFLLRNGQPPEQITFRNTAGGLRSDHIRTIFEDREGVVWFGTDRGVCRYDEGSFHAARLAANDESNFVRSLLVTSQGETLAGTNHGMFILPRGAKPGAWRPVPELAGRVILTLTEDRNGGIWAGVGGAVFVRRRDASVFTQAAVKKVAEETDATVNLPSSASPSPASSRPPASSSAQSPGVAARYMVRALAVFRGQMHALFYGRGIERVAEESRELLFADESARRALCLAVERDAQGNDIALWAGTEKGELWRYDGQKRQTVFRTADQGGRVAPVRAIAFVNGQVWLGTDRELIELPDRKLPEDKPTVVAPDVDVQDLLTVREQGIPEVMERQYLGRLTPGRNAADSRRTAEIAGEADIPALAAGGREVLWVATRNRGLLKLIPRDRVFARFDTEQGLPSSQVFAVAAAADGAQIWIGASRGVVLHHPSPVAPRIEPRRFVADRVYGPDDMAGDLRLPHTQTSFLLEITGLGNTTYPGQFQYEYTWRDHLGRPLKSLLTSDSQFGVDRARVGTYSLYVRAISRDLVWSEPLLVRFRIATAPFPWTTVMLVGLLAVAVMAAGYAFIQNRRIARTNRRLGEINTELAETRLRLASETETERRRIARDLHDQTLADLRHLLVLTDQLEKAGDRNPAFENQPAPAPAPALLRREIESISNEIRHICEDLSPSALENLGFLPALEWALSDAVAHLPAGEKFTWEFNREADLEERLELSEIERIQLYRIVQEAINNICRHAQARRVTADVRTSRAGELLITITDDGIGFDGAGVTVGGHGVANIRSRANLIGATVAWTPLSPGGCRFEARKEMAVREREMPDASDPGGNQ
ncbi:MAG: two-component regulator propeller domain-containing protein [Blastocatellia bacterium]